MVPSIDGEVLSLSCRDDLNDDKVSVSEEGIDLLESINESLNPSDDTRLPVNEKLAKLINKLKLTLQSAKRLVKSTKEQRINDLIALPEQGIIGLKWRLDHLDNSFNNLRLP